MDETQGQGPALSSVRQTLNQLSAATFNSSVMEPMPIAAGTDVEIAAPAFAAFANGTVSGTLAPLAVES
jgi:hypothetical protein